MLSIVNNDSKITDALDLMFSDACLYEISCIDLKAGPLVEFPASINENIYAEIVDFGLEKCPRLMYFIVNMVVKRGEPVVNSHVLKVATIFSTICYAVNTELDALVKLRSLTLQADGLSNIGLDILSDMGLAQCARSLSNHRDMFAEVGPQVANATALHSPYQSTIDNCDYQSEHLTIESVERETISTEGLDTVKMTKNSALKLFDKKLLLMDEAENRDERDHLLTVIGLEAAKVLVAARPNASVLSKYLPRHHKHQNSDKKLTPALSFILKPYPYQARCPVNLYYLICQHD